MNHAVAQDPDVGVLVASDGFAAAHAAREQGVNGSGHLLDGGIVMARGDIHDTLSSSDRGERARLLHATEPMRDVQLNLMQHMRWADALVADALDRDPPPPADIVELFAHIAAVEHLWYARIHGRSPIMDVWPALTAAQARAVATEHAELFEQLVQSGDDALARRVRYRNSAGREFDNSAGEIVTHVAMHGSHHRGQILQRLRASGREPPYVDFIQFMRRDQAG